MTDPEIPSSEECAVGPCDRDPVGEIDVADGTADVCEPCRRAYRVGRETERRLA